MPHAPVHQARALLTLTALLGGGAGAQATPPPPAQTQPSQTQPAQSPPAQSAPAQSAPATTPVPPAPAAPDSPASLLAALRSAPDWRSADLTYRAALLTLESARTRAGLSLSAGATGSLTKLPWDTGSWNGSATITVSAGLSILPWSAALEGVRSAQRALDSAGVTLRTSRASLTVQLLQAYAGARQAADQRALANAQVALATRQVAVAADRRAQGLLSAEGELAARATLDSAQAAQGRAVRATAQTARTLARLLGRAVTLPVTGADFSPLGPTTVSGTLEEQVARALKGRPEVARARAALADATAGVTAAQLDARLPDVTASAIYGQLSDAQGNAGKTVSASLSLKTGVLGVQASLPTRDTSAIPSGLSLSLSATIPLLGSTAGTALRQAQLGLAQAQLALDSAAAAVELDVRSRADALQDEQAALAAATTTDAQARTALTSTQARVAAGLATTLDLDQATVTAQQAAQALAAQQDAVTLAALQLALSTTDLDPLLLTSGGTP